MDVENSFGALKARDKFSRARRSLSINYDAFSYLYVDPPDASGRIVIDFNKAYSPPCAFTKFAICPLPPRQNRLPFAIEAGEKYSGHPK